MYKPIKVEGKVWRGVIKMTFWLHGLDSSIPNELPPSLHNIPLSPCRQYARMIFLSYHRFTIDKKRLNNLSMEDIMFAAEQIMAQWTVSSATSGVKEQKHIGILIY